MKHLILDRFDEVSLMMNGKLEKLETSQDYEERRIELYAVFDDLTAGLVKIDKCSTNKEFHKYAEIFPDVIDDLTEALKEYFNSYLNSVYEAVKGSLK